MSSDSEYMEHITLRNDLPANEVGFVPMKYEEDIKKETLSEISTFPDGVSYDAEMDVETEINEEKDGIDIDKHQLSYEQQHSIETEEVVCKSDCSTKCYVLLQRLHPDYGHPTNDMVTIKLETNEEKEDVSDGTEIDIEKQNTFINDIKHEVYITEHNSSYEQLKPVKSEDYDNEFNSISLNKLDCDHGQEVNDIETNKCFNWRDKTQIRKTIIEHCKLQFNRKTEWHECHLCNFKTQYKMHLRQHHTSKHNIFYCSLCDYKTKNKHNLLNHHRSIHDNAAEIFHCNLCDYKTKNKYSLMKHHTLKHDDETKILICDLCDYSTKSKYQLLRHYKLKHDDTAKIFHCELCNYKTKCKYRMKYHRSKHNEKRRKMSDKSL